jgi:hypothetical protein
VFVDYLIVGCKHVLPLGLDHVLFIVALCLSVERIKSAILFATLFTFTLAHSISLALGVFGYCSINPAIIETLIALSIFFLAIQNILSKENGRLKPLLVFCFGLIHGLGFAAALKEYGLVKNEFIVSLAGFNIGVEIAQALIIISVFGLLFLLKNWSLLNTIKKLVSFAIGLIALIWTFERMFSI